MLYSVTAVNGLRAFMRERCKNLHAMPVVGKQRLMGDDFGVAV